MTAVILCALLAIASTTPLTTATKKANDYRLPENVIPDNYNIKLKPLLSTETDPDYFEGTVTIKVQVLEVTTSIILHAKDLTIKNVTVVKEDDTEVSVIPSEDPTFEFLSIINNDGKFEVAKYTITISYEGIHSDDMDGFYRSSYMENGEKK